MNCLRIYALITNIHKHKTLADIEFIYLNNYKYLKILNTKMDRDKLSKLRDKNQLLDITTNLPIIFAL